MKIRFTRKVIFGIVAYIVLCTTTAILWDFVFSFELPFSSAILAGVFTIIGGFGLAYWLIESVRIEREAEQRKREREREAEQRKREAEQRKRERERKERVLSALKTFKNYLWPWLFHYAHALSGRFGLYDPNRLLTGKYKGDIPQLEDIFGIAVFDKDGKRLRGTEEEDSIRQEMFKRELAPQFLYNDLEYGLHELGHIEARIDEFPSVVEEVNPDVAKIVHLPELIRSRITLLKDWEKKHDKKGIYQIDSSESNLAIRINLRTVGKYALEVAIAINANIEKLEAELQLD